LLGKIFNPLLLQKLMQFTPPPKTYWILHESALAQTLFPRQLDDGNHNAKNGTDSNNRIWIHTLAPPIKNQVPPGVVRNDHIFTLHTKPLKATRKKR
jgi:hypothetical protein